MKYVYINPEYLIKNQIFTSGECKQKKILNPFGGKRQHAGVFILDGTFKIWIPEQTINNEKQFKYISSKDYRFYRFQCEKGNGIGKEHYLCIRDCVIVPDDFVMVKFSSPNDQVKLEELRINKKILIDKINYCSKHNLIKQEHIMKKAYSNFQKQKLLNDQEFNDENESKVRHSTNEEQIEDIEQSTGRGR